MPKKRKRATLTLGHVLAGEQLDVVNQVLRYHGLKEAEKPGTLIDILQPNLPIELGRYVHVINEITDALESEEIDEAQA